jgi:DNA replication protein DnaC
MLATLNSPDGDGRSTLPTVADAVLDRLVHNSHRLTLKGESLRKAAAKRQKLDAEPTK